MKATFDIDDDLMRRVNEEAARRNTSVSALVEAGVRLILDAGTPPERMQDLPPLPTWNGGPELVDVANRDELYAIFDQDDFNLRDET